jgi:DNA repair protein RecO
MPLKHGWRAPVGTVAYFVPVIQELPGEIRRLSPCGELSRMRYPSSRKNASYKAFTALTRFLDALDETPLRDGARAVHEPIGLSFQLKLLWVSGLLPHLTACVECGALDGLVAYAPGAGGAVCADCDTHGIRLAPEGIRGIEALLTTPIADAAALELTDRALRDALAVVSASYEHHGGFRLRTASTS